MDCLLSPSILSFELPKSLEKVKELDRLKADILHLDVMDGQFVPPISFGAEYVRSLRPHVTLPFEAHLMTLTPERHLEAFVEAGCERIIFHAEATRHSHYLAQSIRKLGVSAGIALNPGTPVDHAIEIAGEIDLVLVMTVNPGWGGQKFLRHTLQKVRRLREELPQVKIEVDGGIDPHTLPLARREGANVFVVGGYLAKADDMEGAFLKLREQCC